MVPPMMKGELPHLNKQNQENPPQTRPEANMIKQSLIETPFPGYSRLLMI